MAVDLDPGRDPARIRALDEEQFLRNVEGFQRIGRLDEEEFHGNRRLDEELFQRMRRLDGEHFQRMRRLDGEHFQRMRRLDGERFQDLRRIAQVQHERLRWFPVLCNTAKVIGIAALSGMLEQSRVPDVCSLDSSMAPECLAHFNEVAKMQGCNFSNRNLVMQVSV